MGWQKCSGIKRSYLRGSRLNPAGSGDLRPLQAKSETHCLMLFSTTI
ncbi:Uncharacterised protein [Shigella sonnei]|nr:Uncharacterised protein [Shigella sonnei]